MKENLLPIDQTSEICPPNAITRSLRSNLRVKIAKLAVISTACSQTDKTSFDMETNYNNPIYFTISYPDRLSKETRALGAILGQIVFCDAHKANFWQILNRRSNFSVFLFLPFFIYFFLTYPLLWCC